MNDENKEGQNRLLPQFYYQEQLEAEYIREAGDKLWRLYHTEVSRLAINQFILTADEKGIAAYEELFEILPDVTTEDLAFRRLRLMNRNLTKPPFTLEYLLDQLDRLCGNDKYTVALDNNHYRITIRLELTVRQMFDEVVIVVKRIMPANLLTIVELRFRQHREVGQYTHRQLKFFTHREIRELVPIVLNSHRKLGQYTHRQLSCYTHRELSRLQQDFGALERKTHKDLSGLTHKELSQYTHKEIRRGEFKE